MSPKRTAEERNHTAEGNSRRPSVGFYDIQLEDKERNAAEEERGRTVSITSPMSERSVSGSQDTAAPTRTSNMSVSSTSGFGMGWSSKQSQNQAQPPPLSKKLSGPWNFFSRKKTSTGSQSPPQQPPMNRRDTSATVTSINSNPDVKLPPRESLRERFKMARMKEEAGISPGAMSPVPPDPSSATTEVSEESRPASEFGLGIRSPDAISEEGESYITPVSPAPTDKSSNIRDRTGSHPVKMDPNLAPGTVTANATGPPIEPVDWDLWQSVVYEGPAVVAKTGAAELNKAITSGIPSPIRGVVWQVLAQSKSEDLEILYRELVNRGTVKEIAPSPNPNVSNGPLSANSIVSGSTQKESIASSSSSVKSNETPVTTNGMTSPTASHDSDAKLEAAIAAERQSKAREDLAAIKKLEKTIRKDLGARSNYSRYFAAKELQEDLFGVCKAYALYDPAVGYAQGMNFIAMPLLFNMPAEEAFCMMVRIMNHYNLREMFVQEMPGLHLHLHQFEKILEDVEPALYYHLRKRGITPALYATQWFLTLFAYRFPLQLVLRVYDLILSEGLETAILKFGIAVMRRNVEALLKFKDMSQLKTFLNEKLFDAYIDTAPSSNSILESGFFGSSGGSEKEIYRADLLVQDACGVEITPGDLKAYATEYEARTREEKERQAELENLRTSTASQALKIRSLEERAEKADADHVQMATEMIQSRMENEELRTGNEELKAKVEEMKRIIAKQPEEVEQRLKKEMDRIMTRNIEVQNDNRKLEDDMAEMEKDLVTTKMQFAEVTICASSLLHGFI